MSTTSGSRGTKFTICSAAFGQSVTTAVAADSSDKPEGFAPLIRIVILSEERSEESKDLYR
jgi:hypothetical protein